MEKSLVIAVIAVISCFLFLFKLVYEDQVCEINYKFWDIKNTTAADFAIEVRLPEEVWTKWKLACNKKADHQAAVLQF